MSSFKERNEHFARAMTDAQVSYIEAERAACDLEADNRKLRELVRDCMLVFGLACHDYGCKYERHTDCSNGCVLLERAKKLGVFVEVDE